MMRGVGDRERRLARNEALFREVNEKVRSLAEGPGSDAHLDDYFCECADVDCVAHLQLATGEYESARAESTWFIVTPGHERPMDERIVTSSDRFVIVEKLGETGQQAAELDPRD
jgi:hypothetical protein